MKAQSRKSKRVKLQGPKLKRGLDLSPEEAHRLWSVALAGKEFGGVAYVYGLQNTAVAVAQNPAQLTNKTEEEAKKENQARREVIGKFLRSWADNIEGKA